jgi:hypothetical protein
MSPVVLLRTKEMEDACLEKDQGRLQHENKVSNGVLWPCWREGSKTKMGQPKG